jgi:hypothetical protein
MMPTSFRENFEFAIIFSSSSVIADEDWLWFAPYTLKDGSIGQKFQFA